MDIDYSRLCYGCFRERGSLGSTPSELAPDDAVCPHCGFDASAEPIYPLALQPGSILNGRYLVGRPLGQGGFGITYLAFDMTLQIKVAIKEFLPTGMVSRDSDRSTVILLSRRNDGEFRFNKEKFLDEARILARLSDAPNIVKVQNYFTENNTAYFTMEYVDGISLKERVAQQGGRLPWELVSGYLLPIASALVQVHAENLLHRDISPDNIYLTRKGTSKLLDFGAARSSGGDARSMSIILKHGFAPEEQYRTHGRQGPWTDVYALAATYYYCLTGTLTPDSIDRLHTDTLVAPSQLGVNLPPGAEAALLKALAVHGDDRFRDMQAFMDAVTGKVAPLEPSVPPTFAASSVSSVPFVPPALAATHSIPVAQSPAVAPSAPFAAATSAAATPAPATSPALTPAPTAPAFSTSASTSFRAAPAHTALPPVPARKPTRLPLLIGGSAVALVLVIATVALLLFNPFSGSSTTGQGAADNGNAAVQGPSGSGSGSGSDSNGSGSGSEGSDSEAGGTDNGRVEEVPTVSGYYYSTDVPIAIISSAGWEIDDSQGSLTLTSPSESAVISFFQADNMSPATFALQKTVMMETAAESFDALSYEFLFEENRIISGYDFYVLAFTMEIDDEVYAVWYYVTSDNVRGGIVTMWLEMPDATDTDRADMESMLGSLLVL
ncbi:MAG: protein kinase [Coriobacteriales bacterium]|jgi:serine/threonine protein kinase|nr:protein kinase [Coriobacteriales bacterium]